MPAAAARADNNNRRSSGLRRWRKTCAIMTKGLTDSNALHPTIPDDQTSFVSPRSSALNSYERAPKLILPLLPLLFTEQILTVIVLLQACCLWNKNDVVNTIVTTQRSSKSASDNVKCSVKHCRQWEAACVVHTKLLCGVSVDRITVVINSSVNS